jgi:glutamine amidotransferase
MITIVDYGAGNIGSIENMIKRCGGKSLITSCPVEIDKAKKLIIPGVGSFDFGMNKLKENGLIEILNKKVIKEKIPVLGICLGMQLMTLESEEGEELGLGWINAKVKKFQSEDSNNRIPHMGWNLICLKKDSIIFGDLDLNVPDRKFYFVHSYYVNSYDST